MSEKKYSIRKISEEVIYGFESTGPKGNIAKQVRFWLMEDELVNIFNVGFGDFDNETGNLNDIIVTNNGDTFKILTAVTDIIVDFTVARTDAFVYIEGSTAARTRLYQMWIFKLLQQTSRDFTVLGEYNDHWYLFEKGINYDAFLIKRT